MAGFPPLPTFPNKIDTDKTLYLVYNTSEAIITTDLNAWFDEIDIVPTENSEIWADNGFANIEGELFYYDSVSKDDDDKVVKLKRCVRGWGGKPPKFNSSGTMVRGFVIAEHHNQLADAIIKMENFIVPLSEDLDDLEEELLAADDHKCPDVNFEFIVTNESLATGTDVTYTVTITGTFASYKLDFGDGTSTTLRSGTHNYPPNSTIDPVVIIENNTCSTVITPSNRTPTVEPQISSEAPAFEVPLIPDPIEVPDFDFEFPSIPVPTFTFPPALGPCLNLGPLGPIPSVITIRPPINLPSRISITGLRIPSRISVIGNITIPSMIRFSGNLPSRISLVGPKIPSVIRFANVPTFPSRISFVGINIPTSIDLVGKIPSRITLGGNKIPSRISFSGKVPPSKIKFIGKLPPSKISIVGVSKISFAKPPKISVKWGKPPKVSVIMVCNTSSTPTEFRSVQSLDYSSSDPYEELGFSKVYSSPVIEANISPVGIPNEIRFAAPVFPDLIIKDSLPKEILLKAPHIPSVIRFRGPRIPIPSEIKVRSRIPSRIVLEHSLPKSIKLDATDVPKVIKLDVPKEFPKVQFDMSTFPKSIKLEAPETIKVKCEFPQEIVAKLQVPENFQVPLVYSGGPIPFKFDDNRFSGDEDYPCFAITPCPKK
jgi:PKD repeat protein